MAAADRDQDPGWLQLHQRRIERTRFEVLYMLYDAANHCVDFPVDIGGFVRRLGVWEDALADVLEYLDQRGYVTHRREGGAVSVCLTVKGVDYIERDRGRRRTIRD